MKKSPMEFSLAFKSDFDKSDPVSFQADYHIESAHKYFSRYVEESTLQKRISYTSYY